MTKLDAPTAKRGRPPKARAGGGADTRDLILDAAEDLFSKHGFYGVTIREVAREAGCSTRSSCGGPKSGTMSGSTGSTAMPTRWAMR
jgi:hypothetical protein